MVQCEIEIIRHLTLITVDANEIKRNKMRIYTIAIFQHLHFATLEIEMILQNSFARL